MRKERTVSFDELSPFICKAGKQNQVPWKNRYRRIYDHEFIYCSSGKAHAILEDREYTLNPGSLILIRPDVPHSFWKDEEAPGEQYWVHFDFIYRKDVYDMNKFASENNTILFTELLPQSEFIREDVIFENGFSFPEYIEVDQSEIMEEIFYKLISCFEQHDILWQMECKVYLLQVLNLLLHQFNGDTTDFSRNEGQVSKIVIQYICKNYFRKIYIKELANIIGLSEDYVGKIFRKQTGMTIIQFIEHIRIQKAKELLLKTNLTIENISEIVGYSDVFYFSKVIKKSEGCSPSLLRKKHNIK